MIDVKSGVQCRYCRKELYEAEFVRNSGWPLRKDPPSVHFCNDTCKENFNDHGMKTNIRDNYVMRGSAQEAMLSGMSNKISETRTTDNGQRDTDKDSLVERFEDDAV